MHGFQRRLHGEASNRRNPTGTHLHSCNSENDQLRLEQQQDDQRRESNQILSDSNGTRLSTHDRDNNNTATELSMESEESVSAPTNKRSRNNRTAVHKNETFKVYPDYAYPQMRFTREQIQIEMTKSSSQFHNLHVSDEPKGIIIGQVSIEVLQCFGIPSGTAKSGTVSSSQTAPSGRQSLPFGLIVCGKYAFQTDCVWSSHSNISTHNNPMWLSKMRRACTIPLYHAYARIYIGI
jgi:hypothetical protein